MRLIDLDKLDCTGKTVLMRFLEAYEKKHPIEELQFSIKEYDVILHPQKDYFEVKKRDEKL